MCVFVRERAYHGPLLDVCERELIMDPLLDFCEREPILDPLLDVFEREPIMDPSLMFVRERTYHGPPP